jgi:putative restriction endonuclease
VANAVFTTSESSIYDDLPEVRYHFPSTYLRQVQATIGDWILYYEPRRTEGPNSSTGRQAYFAIARVSHIDQDVKNSGHHYAYLNSYLEFDEAVPFRVGDTYHESMLQKSDGTTNRGSFGRSVRLMPAEEFASILTSGFNREFAPWEISMHVAEPVPEYVSRPIIEQVINRKFRDRAFRSHVRAIYRNTCALTGLQLINGGGRPEVQAAHIRSVEDNGPDSIRNGIALTGTVHWLFDRGLISFEDDGRVLQTGQGLPDLMQRLLPSNGKLKLPEQLHHRPHPIYLRWHRENKFKP